MAIIKIFSVMSLIIFIYCMADINSVSLDTYEIHSDIFDNLNTQHPKAAIYQRLLDSLTKAGVPGAVMLIKSPSNDLWAGASGKADIGSNISMQINHIGRIASITKMFTAVTIMRLVEEGKIKLEDKAKKWLPQDVIDHIKNCNEVTIRQLLNHSSGIVNYVEDINFLLDGVNNQNKDRNWNDLLHYTYRKDAYFKTGTDFHYSNTNYLLLGKVIEGACNESHSQIIQEKIISPLHLNCTYYDPDAPIPNQMVRGYMDYHNDGKITDITHIHNHTKLYSDAGVITNVYDLMLFCEALFNGKLLADTTLRKMTEWIPADEEEMAGLGLFSSRTGSYGQCIGHTGYTFGFLSRLFYFPEKKIIFVLMVNGSLGSISKHVTDFTKTSNNNRNEIFDAIFSDE